MKHARRMLISGLPAGLGASSFSHACADALKGMGRSVLLLSSLAALPELGNGQPARQLSGAFLFPRNLGPDLLPLELLEDESLPDLLALLDKDYDFILMDRFTGLNVRDSLWYAMADEVLVLVDARPGQEARSLMLMGKILAQWPDKELRFLYSRAKTSFGWDNQIQRMQRRLAGHFGRSVPCLGVLPEAAELHRARVECRPFCRMYPNHPASRRLRQMARHLLMDQSYTPPQTNLQEAMNSDSNRLTKGL